MEIILDKEIVEVVIVYKNNKNIYTRFKEPNRLEVSCSPLVKESKVLEILKNNEKSLIKMMKKKKEEASKDAYFWYLGRKYIPVFDSSIKNVTFSSLHIYASDEKMLNKFYQKECLRVFTNEVNRIVPYFKNIPSFKLKIRNMKTRWGVNNQGNKTITLNSELLKKDIDLLDYVIIHELCHFYEANHSSRFWRHVENYYPKYKEARRRLRD